MTVSIKISVNNSPVREIDGIAWSAEMNVQKAMELAYSAGSGYSFSLQYFGANLSYEAVSIDSISTQAGTDFYLFWELAINGKIATKGIDETILNDGDVIGWNYTSYKQAVHGSTRYEALKNKLRT